MNIESTHNQKEILATGVRLRNAREQLGLSQQAVAERLCLKVSTVRDIEEDKMPSDLASPFLRGYIRSYAKLVHIPEDELLAMMEKKQPSLQEVKVSAAQSFSKHYKRRDGWLMTFTWLALCAVIGVTGAWWWNNHKAPQEKISAMSNQFSAELDNMAEKREQNVTVNTKLTAPITTSKVQTSARVAHQVVRLHS